MIYLDHHATTPLDPRVLEAMLPYLREHYGNPGSPHAYGRAADAAVSRARTQVARLIGAEPDEIVFTSGATESDNLGLRGVAAFYRDLGDHLVTTTIEHNAVRKTADELVEAGLRVTRVPVDHDGLVDPAAVTEAIEPGRTILVSVMHANNEIGTVQPLAEIAAVTRAAGVLLHTDAVQSIGKVPFDVGVLDVDLVSMSAHKMYGPKGVGALYVRGRGPRVRVVAQLAGGGQEGRRRAGTLNVPGIVGMGAAAELAAREGAAESRRVGALRDRLQSRLEEALGARVRVNGSLEHRLTGNLSICIDDVDGRALVLELDRRGVACSTGSACSKGMEPSHVLRALGLEPYEAFSALRIGLGRWTTMDEVDRAAAEIVGAVGHRATRISREET